MAPSVPDPTVFYIMRKIFSSKRIEPAEGVANLLR
ncbi:pathogenicity-like protein, partial [Xanthomonas vasicola pv. musacearum NCPPB 4392]